MIARDDTLDMSLCVILPVHDVQDQIARQLSDLLEILPDLTRKFQIVVVDDASTDHTEDVVQELAQRFPQIAVVRHSVKRGTQAAVETGLGITDADIVFVHQPNTRVSQARLSRLWQMRNDNQLVLANAIPEPKPMPRRLIDSLVRWGMSVTEMDQSSADTGGIQMIRQKNTGDAAAQVATAKEISGGRISRTDQAQSSVAEVQSTGSSSRNSRRARARAGRPG